MAKKGGAPENLKPVRSKEEARERGRNGGKKSGEARRKKRDAQQAARLILDLPVSAEATANNLKKMFVQEEDLTNRVALFARAFAQAMSGDIKAMQFIVEMAGETPDQKLNKKRVENEIIRQNGTSTTSDIMEEGDDVVIIVPDNGRKAGGDE